VDLTATLDAPCPPETLFEYVADLAAYTRWLSIVPRAEPSVAHPGDAGPAWSVELRGRIGPLARSKRLRMVRTRFDPPRSVRFERREVDGREHSPWVLDATVSETAEGSRLEMHLFYGGGFGGAMLERLLSDEIDESKPRLLTLVAQADRTG
jgi:uncharacterized protein YndB with AHSA1/START domain